MAYPLTIFFPNDKPLSRETAKSGGFAGNMYLAAEFLGISIVRADSNNYGQLSVKLAGPNYFDSLKLLFTDFPDEYVAPTIACLLMGMNWVYVYDYISTIHKLNEEENVKNVKHI